MKALALAFLALFLVIRPSAARAEGELPMPPHLMQLLMGGDDEPTPDAAPSLKCPEKAKLCVFPYRFSAEVTDESVDRFQKFLAASEKAGAKAVMLELNTAGGDPEAGHEMTRSIEMSPVRVICVADGVVASAGMYIFQSCDVRYMTKRSMLVTHNIHLQYKHGTEDNDVITIVSARDTSDTLAVASAAFAEQIVHRAKNITIQQYIAKVAYIDWEMGYAEALHYGFIDKVFDRSPGALYTTIRDTGALP
jgi:ATP-dependent protease ClpP protease subunit